MWANHTYIDCHPFAPGKNFSNAEVWRRGEISRAGFERQTQDAIKTYFKQPNYWKIDGKPYFLIYELKTMIAGLGGIEATRAAFDDFRRRTKAAGFPGLHLNLVDWSFSECLAKAKGQAMPGDPSKKIETEKDLLKLWGRTARRGTRGCIMWCPWRERITNPKPASSRDRFRRPC